MNGEHDPLRAGACMTLPDFVIDKHFLANGNTEHFETETARAICARCIVKALCLTREPSPKCRQASVLWPASRPTSSKRCTGRLSRARPSLTSLIARLTLSDRSDAATFTRLPGRHREGEAGSHCFQYQHQLGRGARSLA